MREQLLSIHDPECWRPIGDYLVSSHGRVANERGRILKPQEHKGYRRVYLRDKKVRIHVLVAKAFIGDPDPNHVVDHLDTDKSHNCPVNLEWVTHAENMRRHYQRKRVNHDCAAQLKEQRTLYACNDR